HSRAQHFCDGPVLRDGTSRSLRFAGIEHFADRADAVLVHALGKTFEELQRIWLLFRMHFEPRVDERPDEPGPDRALVIRAVPGPEIAAVNWFVVGMFRGKRTKPDRCHEFALGDVNDRFPTGLVED